AVLIADSCGVSVELAKRLASDGIKPLVISAAGYSSYDDLLAEVTLDRRTLIVFAAGLARHGGSPESAAWKGLAHYPAVPALLSLAQTLHKREAVPRVFVVTNGAAGVSGDAQLDLGQAILHGMARVIKNELPNMPLTVVDLGDPTSPTEVAALYQEVSHNR